MRQFAFGRITAALLLLAACPNKSGATSIADLSLIYHVSFDDGTLNPDVDTRAIGAMKLGSSETSGANPTWVLEDGGLTLGVTQPVGTTAPVSSGVFATPVDFGPGSILGMRATFTAPSGPHSAGSIWAVSLGARTGDESDLAGETRAGATLQSRGNVARLNVVGASVPPTPVNLAPAAFDALYSITNPNVFTLELIVDRVGGVGYEALYFGQTNVFSRSFTYAAFLPDGGPSITSIGPSIAISTAPGQTASVRLLDFQVFSVGESSEGILPIAVIFLFLIGRWRRAR